MIYHNIAPKKELASFVINFAHLKRNECTSSSGRFIPNGNSSLVFHFKDSFTLYFPERKPILLPLSFFVGQVCRPAELKPGIDLDTMLVMFKPTALYHLFGLSMTRLSKFLYIKSESVITNFHDLYTTLKHTSDINMRCKILSDFFVELIKNRAPVFDHVEEAVDYILESHGTCLIEEVANHLNIEHRKLRQHFLKKVGITPKMFARITRVNEAVHLLNSEKLCNWHDISFAMNYYDQAHFIKDFSMIVGEAPTKFLKYKGISLNIMQGKNPQ